MDEDDGRVCCTTIASVAMDDWVALVVAFARALTVAVAPAALSVYKRSSQPVCEF